MKERPILFSAPMVRAILEGRKTQTRRVVKQRIIPVVDECFRVNGKWCNKTFDYDLGALCPYGQPGDRLWVRETAIISPPNWNDGSDCNVKDDQGRSRIVQWIASYPNTEGAGFYRLKKVPSIFMPRWASRITLEIIGIRVERLQDISNEDIRAEGAAVLGCVTHRLNYQTLWESINGPDSWAINPWVWVIEFRKVEQ
jgi:hypothetical protein